jgi:hypothetical protein
MKDVVLLMAALIMMFGHVDRNRVDAVAAMVLVVLIAMGAVWTLPAICNTATILIWGVDGITADKGRDEEQNLIGSGSENYGTSTPTTSDN